MTYDQVYSYIILPAAYIAGGTALGFIIEKIIIGRLRRLQRKTQWPLVEVIAGSLRGVVTFWFLIAGIYAAISRVDLPETLESTLDKALVSLIILTAALTLARFGAGAVKVYAAKSEGLLPATSIFSILAKLIILGVGALVVLQYLNIPITPILTALGVGGLAVALALQDTLANLFAGLHIIASRQVGVGDFVKLDTGEEGFVRDISWRNTVIQALQNNMIIVPNSKIASIIITNYSLPTKDLSVLVQVGVSYDSDLKQVERVTIEVGREIHREVEGAVPEAEPLVRFHTFGESSINFTVVLRAQEFVTQHIIKHEFVKKLQERYGVEGITIPFPIRTVYLKDQSAE